MQLASKIKRKILKVIDRCVCFIINRLPLTFDQKRYACHKIQKTLRNTSFSYSNALSMRQLLIDMCEQKSLSVEDELIYKKRLQELQKNYKRIYILRPQAMNMGNMCVNYWYVKLILEQKKDNELILLMSYDREDPVYSAQHPMVANQYFYGKISSMIDTINEDDAAFWGYVIKKTHRYVRCENLRDYFYFSQKPDLATHLLENQYPNKCYMEYSHLEQQRGIETLKSAGCEKGNYVCIFSRNNDYHGGYYNDAEERDKNITSTRNSSIEDFFLASESLAESGIKSVRVGAVDFRKIGRKNLIDYTNTFRSEFMDFYLMGHAKFFLGDASGIMYIPLLQNVPLAITNNLTIIWHMEYISNYNSKRCFSIYKKWYDKNKGRYLSVREIMMLSRKVGLSTEVELQIYHDKGIEFHANSAEEIHDLAMEMNARLDGTWVDLPQAKLLRERYWKIVNQALEKSSHRMMLLDYEPGSLFLLKNQWLLE
jgi:hypothetical protein